MSIIQYPFAHDENGNLIYINNVHKETRYDHKYTCPCCGSNMEPRLGEHNAHCFAHSSSKSCTKETYIHHAAKKIIEKRFNEGSLNIKIYRNFKCKTPCEHLAEGICSGRTKLPYSLSTLYDTVLVEKNISSNDGIYRPDITISDSKGNLPPILLEICNTSPCTTSKLEDCKNIIEIKVKEFADLVALQESDYIEESEDTLNYSVKKNVASFNFKTLKYLPQQFPKEDNYYSNPVYKPFCLLSREEKRKFSSLWKMYWYKSGKFFHEQVLDDEIDQHKDSSVFELVIEPRGHLKIDIQFFSIICRQYPELRLCNNCSEMGSNNFGERWCKHNGSTQKGTFNEEKASKCRYFQTPSIFGQEPRIIQFWHNPDNVRPHRDMEKLHRYQAEREELRRQIEEEIEQERQLRQEQSENNNKLDLFIPTFEWYKLSVTKDGEISISMTSEEERYIRKESSLLEITINASGEEGSCKQYLRYFLSIKTNQNKQCECCEHYDINGWEIAYCRLHLNGDTFFKNFDNSKALQCDKYMNGSPQSGIVINKIEIWHKGMHPHECIEENSQ